MTRLVIETRLLQPAIDSNAKYDHFTAFASNELLYKR